MAAGRRCRPLADTRPVRVALLNLAFDPDLPDEEALAERFGSLGRFARELQAAGIDVAVLQRFRRDRDLVLEGLDNELRPGRAPHL